MTTKNNRNHDALHSFSIAIALLKLVTILSCLHHYPKQSSIVMVSAAFVGSQYNGVVSPCRKLVYKMCDFRDVGASISNDFSISTMIIDDRRRLRLSALCMVEGEQGAESNQQLDANTANGDKSINSIQISYEAPPSSTRKQLGEQLYILVLASTIGYFSGLTVVVFKESIDFVRMTFYESDMIADMAPPVLIPAVGGVLVGMMILFWGSFAPGLRRTVEKVDAESVAITLEESIMSTKTEPRDLSVANDRFSGNEDQANKRKNGKQGQDFEYQSQQSNDIMRSIRKTVAAVLTLGTGNSLGPEGPAVEAGMTVSRICASVVKPSPDTLLVGSDNSSPNSIIANAIARNRLFLSCGAAAGVSAGFNAPLSGVFFALEIVQQSLEPFTVPSFDMNQSGRSSRHRKPNRDRFEPESLASQSINISAILLSSAISALVCNAFLGKELALVITEFHLEDPFIELPLYLTLGVLSGLTAVLFSGLAQSSKKLFDGEVGPTTIRNGFQTLPKWGKPVIGSLVCGVIGLAFPQILFFGYDTLNALLASKTFPTIEAFQLLIVKAFSTAVAAASGLVGGTFAPSLFLGGMLGVCFHNLASDALQLVEQALLQNLGDGYVSEIVTTMATLQLSEMPAYAMVGAACVLAALFRAPLTASLLLFEITQDYDVLLPLMASAGIAALVGDVVEQALEEQKRDLDTVSWGDLAAADASDEAILVESNDDAILQKSYVEEKSSERVMEIEK